MSNGEMAHRRALLALRVLEAAATGDASLDSLLADEFGTFEEAALAHAYLSGFLVSLVADERRETIMTTIDYARRRLGGPDAGPTSGVREPRMPQPHAPSTEQTRRSPDR